ncbi:MAG TPA: M48 family peptidase, partial [Actinoplanes sp.]
MTPRLWAAGTLAVLVVAAVVVAALTIPWHRPPAPRADQLAAFGQLPREQVDRAREFHAEMRPGSYGAMAISLIGA